MTKFTIEEKEKIKNVFNNKKYESIYSLLLSMLDKEILECLNYINMLY